MRYLRNAREWMSPVLTESQFIQKGVLTPEEFTRAGDQLVRICPTWQWQSGEPSRVREYLPRDKQFLCIFGVPCGQRVGDALDASAEEAAPEEGEGGEWFLPNMAAAAVSSDATVNVASAPDSVLQKVTDAIDEYADMDDDSLALDEMSVLPNPSSGGSSAILKTRRYDMSITYDKYYQTPRVWLAGYDSGANPLLREQVFEDIMKDYAKKTVTVDPHPHLVTPHASIHPCQHANAMLHILETLIDTNEVPSVDQYLLIFLKFVQSIIPTIEYDHVSYQRIFS